MEIPGQNPDRYHEKQAPKAGNAFAMGAIGGSLYHFVKGARNSPLGGRLLGGTQAIRMNGPRVAGSFAVWGGLFSVFDCSMVYLRQKEDPWNSILAGAATGGVLAMRQGIRASARSAILGGAVLALIEGASIMMNKSLAAQQQNNPMAVPVPGITAGVSSGGLGRSGSESRSISWFGRKKKEEGSVNGGLGRSGSDSRSGSWFGRKRKEEEGSVSGGLGRSGSDSRSGSWFRRWRKEEGAPHA